MNITRRKILFSLIYLTLLILKGFEIKYILQVNENIQNGVLYLIGQPQLSVIDLIDLLFFIFYGYLFFKYKKNDNAFNLMEFTFYFGLVSLLFIYTVVSFVVVGFFSNYYIEVIVSWILILLHRKFLLNDIQSFLNARLIVKFFLVIVSLFNLLMYFHLIKYIKLTAFLTGLF